VATGGARAAAAGGVVQAWGDGGAGAGGAGGSASWAWSAFCGFGVGVEWVLAGCVHTRSSRSAGAAVPQAQYSQPGLHASERGHGKRRTGTDQGQSIGTQRTRARRDCTRRVASLDGEAEAGVEQAWDAEILRRIDDVERGIAKALSREECKRRFS
jgi:hypothetical protein